LILLLDFKSSRFGADEPEKRRGFQKSRKLRRKQAKMAGDARARREIRKSLWGERLVSVFEVAALPAVASLPNL